MKMTTRVWHKLIYRTYDLNMFMIEQGLQILKNQEYLFKYCNHLALVINQYPSPTLDSSQVYTGRGCARKDSEGHCSIPKGSLWMLPTVLV